MFAVDVGNSFTRVVAFSGDRIVDRRSLPTRGMTVEDAAAAFEALKGDASGGDVYVSSVAPGVNAVLDAAAQRLGLTRRFIKPGRDVILPHRLTTPETTGADRLLSALAAGRHLFSPEQIRDGYVVVQCGSAATVDLVDAAGVFVGGYIIPGPVLWLSGISAAAQLPDFSSEVPDWNDVAPGDNTRSAILHGMAVTLPGAVATAASGLASGFGADGRRPVAVTGGWGEAVARLLPDDRVYDADLVLHGVRLFAEQEARA